MKYLYIHVVFLSFVFSFGTQGLYISKSAFDIASSSTGIGSSNYSYANPSSLSYHSNSFAITSISWYQGVSGSSMYYKWGEKYHHIIDMNILSSNDIGLWYEVPYDEPIDHFDIHHLSMGLGLSRQLSNLSIGLKSSVSYNQLFLDESYGFNFDLGISYQYTPALSFGLCIKQLGYDVYNEEHFRYPLLIGAGSTFNINYLKTKIYIDGIYREEYSDEFTLKVASSTNFYNMNFILGYEFSDSKKQFSCGFIFKYRKIQIDYGIAFHEALGQPYAISIKYNI